tara:strand:- start:162 stop:401 length:240 start_codon:yes stop_codon:yes gene_type:complete
MTIPTIDARKAWLDELQMLTERGLLKISEKEINGKHISPTEQQYAKLCGAFLYLYKLAEENQILRPDDPDNPFNQETLH